MRRDSATVIEPIRSARTFEEVSNRLKGLIFEGTLKPGQQLPSEVELARMCQVGRQSVREALRILEISGFITVKPGQKGGALIEGTMLSKLSALFLDAFKFNKVSLEEFTEARRALEMVILDFVFKSADSTDIESLKDNIQKADAKIENGDSSYEEDIDFHRLLAKASKNYIFALVEESILAILSDFKSKFTTVTIEQSLDVVSHHRQILQAIINRKKREAAKLLEEDMMIGKKILMENVERS